MLKRRQFLKVSAATSAAVLAGACAPVTTPSGTSAPAASAAPTAAAAAPRRGGTFVQGLVADPAGGSVSVSRNANTIYAFSVPLHSSLVQLDVNRVLQPELAESWTISPDEKTYTFKLRANAKFHDGKPVTSADVKYSFEQVAAKYNSNVQAYASTIERVDAPDAQTVVFVLKKPLCVFLLLVSPQYTAVLPKHIYEGSDPRANPDNQKPVGSGPFKFVEWVKGDHVTVVRNENYYVPGLPYLDKLVFRVVPDAGARSIAFQNGDSDFMGIGSFPAAQGKQISALPGVHTDLRGTPASSWLYVNLTKKPLDDLRVRQAIAAAIDHKAVVDKTYFGLAKPPINHLEDALAPYHNPNAKLPAYDVAAANKLLDEAGYPKGADGRRFSLRLAYDPTYNLGHEVAADSLAAVGIKPELTPMDVATLTKTVFVDGNFDLMNAQSGSGDDPAFALTKYSSTTIGNYYGNGSRYKNPEVDRLLDEGAATTNVEKRKAAYWKIQEILVKDLPIIQLAYVTGIDFYGAKIRGYETSPTGRPWYRHSGTWRTE